MLFQLHMYRLFLLWTFWAIRLVWTCLRRMLRISLSREWLEPVLNLSRQQA